jgi:hypothetical protein
VIDHREVHEAIINAYFAICVAVVLWTIFVEPFWPWDWSGRRKAIKLTPRDRDF